MSYQAQSLLESDPSFQRRMRSAITQQADVFKDDQRPAFSACANAILRDEPGPQQTLLRLGAAGPGIAERVENPDGTIDSSRITDADILSLTQANWPTVAALWFTEDGSPIRSDARLG